MTWTLHSGPAHSYTKTWIWPEEVALAWCVLLTCPFYSSLWDRVSLFSVHRWSCYTLNVRKCLAGFHLLDSEKPARTTFRGFQNIFFSQCFLSVRNIHRVFANFPTQWRFWIICWSEFLSTRIHSLVDVTHFSLFDIRESTPARFTDKPCGIRH